MKNWRTIIVLLLCLILVGTLACNPLGSKQTPAAQEVKVVRGDLKVTASGSGNLEVSKDTKLAFGVGGRVETVPVKEGDSVKKGDVLAGLDTAALELTLAQAQAAYYQSKLAVTQAEVALTQAQLGVQTSQYDLDQALEHYTWPDIKTAQADVDDAKAYVDYVSWNLEQATTPDKQATWAVTLVYAKARLAAAETKLDALVKSYDTPEVAIKKQQLAAAQQSVELAQQSLELARVSPNVTAKSMEVAQKQLDEATITAPFDGIVASISVDEQDIVLPTATVIHLIDPSQMKLDVEVDEIDIVGVQPGQKAIIQIDALPNLSLEGKVSSISLLSTQTGGVVVYDVKIEFDVPEGITMRDGMSATADIITAERTGVLLVPDRSITRDSQGNATVEVMVNGQAVKRAIVAGISDGLQTEVLDGLKEGDVVLEKQASQSSGLGIFGQ